MASKVSSHSPPGISPDSSTLLTSGRPYAIDTDDKRTDDTRVLLEHRLTYLAIRLATSSQKTESLLLDLLGHADEMHRRLSGFEAAEDDNLTIESCRSSETGSPHNLAAFGQGQSRLDPLSDGTTMDGDDRATLSRLSALVEELRCRQEEMKV